ncbi:GrpB family protein [Paenisporosarcina cavernae]|uniref:GrpB family protein n=1 Tax=Paenisporosarcina cavernae TaxID=2320858 RepID=A0A385YW16_9BACL|nr:GrpB family protein [Paenisporosarcina cavernae]AYC30087.1 GrpB family protein [Paenisporosarcina cavernae]
MKVRLTEYTDEWPRRFQEEIERIENHLPIDGMKWEHFESTSVKGMKAKPVIDIICIVPTIEQVDEHIPFFESMGYESIGVYGITGRRFFRKGGENRTHHLHIYGEGNSEIARHLAVRDYLRAHPVEVDLYSAKKEELANQFDETTEYSKAKHYFVSALEKRALKWKQEQT